MGYAGGVLARSLTLATIDSAYGTYYWSWIVTLSYLACFRDIRAFACLKPHFYNTVTPPLFQSKFGGVPFGVDLWCWSLLRQQTPQTNCEFIFKEFQPMWLWYFNVTGGHTERLAIARSNTVLWVTSCGIKLQQIKLQNGFGPTDWLSRV